MLLHPATSHMPRDCPATFHGVYIELVPTPDEGLWEAAMLPFLYLDRLRTALTIRFLHYAVIETPPFRPGQYLLSSLLQAELKPSANRSSLPSPSTKRRRGGEDAMRIDKDIAAELKVGVPAADDQVGRKIAFGEIAVDDALTAHPQAGR